MRKIPSNSGVRRRIVAAAFFVLSPAVAQAPNDCRIAIIIGNAAYPTAPLANPVNDAKSMAVALRKAGFEVFEVRDAGKAQMEEVMERAATALKGRHGVGLFYYAGHGLQVDLRDYLVPIDAQLKQGADVQTQTVDLQEVIEMFRTAGNRTSILVLDACRDNPFAARSTGKGLAPIDAPISAPPGTFLAYATAPGNVADDGDSSTGNGLYTRYLVSELGVGGARIEDVFKRVQVQVRRKSHGRQIPWETSSLEDDFFFDPASSAKPAVDHEKQFAVEKADWDLVKEATAVAPLYEYLLKYPNGLISEQAQFRLDQLETPTLDIQVREEGAKALRSGTNRFAVGDEWVNKVTDGLTGISRRMTRRVTSADDTQVVINNGAEVQDQMGGVQKNSYGTRDPAAMFAPSDIWLGKRWSNAFSLVRGQYRGVNFSDFRVNAFEEVTIPAGSFKAYRVELRGRSDGQDGGRSYYSNTYWVDPHTMLIIKSEFLTRTGGRIDYYDRSELISYKPAPR